MEHVTAALRRVAGLCGLALCLSVPASARAALRVDSAEFLAEGQTRALAVALPDTWVQRGQPTGGLGHYSMRFTLPSAVDTVWALHAERLSSAHEVRLNGQLVHGSLKTYRNCVV
jgi:hypothetical protein